jgi:hypothetical protein
VRLGSVAAGAWKRVCAPVSFAALRRGTTVIYALLTILPGSVLFIELYYSPYPPRLLVAWYFSPPRHYLVLFLALTGLAVGSLVIAALIPWARTQSTVRRLMIPATALVGVALGWGLIFSVLYIVGLLYLFALQRQAPATRAGNP